MLPVNPPKLQEKTLSIIVKMSILSWYHCQITYIFTEQRVYQVNFYTKLGPQCILCGSLLPIV